MSDSLKFNQEILRPLSQTGGTGLQQQDSEVVNELIYNKHGKLGNQTHNAEQVRKHLYKGFDQEHNGRDSNTERDRVNKERVGEMSRRQSMNDGPKREYRNLTICPDTKVQYVGEWVGDMKDGKGKQTWPNGSVYDGYWSKNLPEGQGVFEKPNGDKLSGNFHQGRAHGFATFQ